MCMKKLNEQWKIPITPYNRRLYWLPSWTKCDCGELVKQVYVKKGDFSILMGFLSNATTVENLQFTQRKEELGIFKENEAKAILDAIHAL